MLFVIAIKYCNYHHHHHWAAVVSRSWAKASASRLQVSLSCAVLCQKQIVSLQYLSRSSLHRLAGLPCRLFLSYGLQLVTREVHLSSLRRLICPAQDRFIFSHIADYIYTVHGTSLLRSPAGLGKSDLIQEVICTVEYNLGLSHGDCNGEVLLLVR